MLPLAFSGGREKVYVYSYSKKAQSLYLEYIDECKGPLQVEFPHVDKCIYIIEKMIQDKVEKEQPRGTCNMGSMIGEDIIHLKLNVNEAIERNKYLMFEKYRIPSLPKKEWKRNEIFVGKFLYQNDGKYYGYPRLIQLHPDIMCNDQIHDQVITHFEKLGCCQFKIIETIENGLKYGTVFLIYDYFPMFYKIEDTFEPPKTFISIQRINE